MSDASADIVYGFDPLCGWCYGFGPAFEALRTRFEGRVRWTVASAGLVTGERVRPIREMRDYLTQGMAQVESRTGVRFGEGFRRLLAEGTWVGRSEPLIRMIVQVAKRWPEQAPAFAGGLCEALYGKGLPPEGEAALAFAREKAGLSRAEVTAALLDPRSMEEGAAAMEEAARMGVRTYPSMFLKTTAGVRPIFAGCLPAEEAAAAIEQALAMAA